MSGTTENQGRIDQIKNSTLNARKRDPDWWPEHITFICLVIVTGFQATWNLVFSAVRSSESNATESSLCATPDSWLCNRYPNDMGKLYNDIATGVPLAPSGYLYMYLWPALYFLMVFVHAPIHWYYRADYKMYNWAVHSLLIAYQLTLLFWPMVFSHRNLWLAAGMVFFAGCIIRSVSISASKVALPKDNTKKRFFLSLATETLVVQTTWLGLAALVALSLALKENISTVTLGDDWAALWIALYTVFACGLALYTKTTLGLWAAGGALFAILFRSINTFPGLDYGDHGTNQLTDNFCIAGLCAIFATFCVVLFKVLKPYCQSRIAEYKEMKERKSRV